MEWLRSCYGSQWRLWRNRPDILVPGRFAFAPEGTPHFEHWHNLGSRNWRANEPWWHPGLGEDDQAVQVWFGGKLAEPPPPARVVGSLDCLESGAVYPRELATIEEFAGGFPLRCWEPANPVPALTAAGLNVNDRKTQLRFAQVLALLYTNPSAAQIALQAMLDRPATFTVHPSNGTVFPGLLIAQTDSYTIIVAGGAANEQQLALSAFYMTGPPTNVGAFATNSYFNLVANFIATEMFAAGVDSSLPILYAGHSLGGAATTILAARTIQTNPSADVRIVTYGTPRPGDDRLRTIIGGISSVNVVNVGDWFSQLPPVLREFYPLAAEVLPEFGTSWVNWADTANRQAMAVDGSIVSPGLLAISWPDLAAAIGAALEGGELPPLTAHSIAEYVRRLGLQ